MSVPAKEHIGQRGWMKKRLPKKKNLFITDPNASYAGKDSWRALKITNNYYQHRKKSSIHTLWAKSAQLLFRVKFISRNRPLINWGGCGRLALYATHCIYYVVPIW